MDEDHAVSDAIPRLAAELAEAAHTAHPEPISSSLMESAPFLEGGSSSSQEGSGQCEQAAITDAAADDVAVEAEEVSSGTSLPPLVDENQNTSIPSIASRRGGRGGARGGFRGTRASHRRWKVGPAGTRLGTAAGPYWKGEAGQAFPRPQPQRRPYPSWPAWDDLVQKLYVLDWEDSAEWYVPMKTKLNEQEISDPIAKRLLDNDLEREAKLEVVKERRKSLKSLVRYNLVQGRIARAIPAKSRTYHFPCRVKKPLDDAEVDYMGMLPLEVLYLVFSFLDPIIDMPVASSVCKVWNLIASDPLFWIPAMRRRDIMGNTVLHLAASSIDEERALRTCSHFIQRGALVDVPNRRGITPIDIAQTLDHQVLHLYLVHHSETSHRSSVKPKSRPRRARHWGDVEHVDVVHSVPYAAYMRVVERIHLELLRLYPLPKLRLVEKHNTSWNGLPMHRLLPKKAFAFLMPTGEPYDHKTYQQDRSLENWTVGLAEPSRPTSGATPAGDGKEARPKLVYTSVEPSFWQTSQEKERQRLLLLSRRVGRRTQTATPKQPALPPNVNDRRSFPALPKRRNARKDRREGTKQRSAQQPSKSVDHSSSAQSRPASFRKDKGKERVG